MRMKPLSLSGLISLMAKVGFMSFFFLVRFQVGLENKQILKPRLKDKIPSYKQVGKAEIQKL